MAIYRLALKVLSRSNGAPACAAASYRSGEAIDDERYGRRWHYSRRSDRVRATRLIGWSGTRADLWNAAEASEVRCNSRVAREIQLALPRELDTETQLALAISLAQHLRGRYGVAADVALHDSHDGNPHAHLMITTRRVVRGEFREKTRELDDKRSGPEEIEHMRAEWGSLVNDALEAAGSDARVDHRSLERQGIDRTPVHLPRAARALEDRGIVTTVGRRLRAALRTDWARSLLKDLQDARRRSADKIRDMIRRVVRSTAEVVSPDRRLDATRRRQLDILDQAEEENGSPLAWPADMPGTKRPTWCAQRQDR